MPTKLFLSDILEVETDVMVLSAHPTLMAGGGISGVIHSAAGPELEAASRLLGPIEAGSAVITDGFQLDAKHVIHAVAPRFMKGDALEMEMLRATYRAALALNEAGREMQTIVFPAIGAGIYRWPLDIAASIAVEELSQSRYARTIVSVLGEANFLAYKSVLPG